MKRKRIVCYDSVVYHKPNCHYVWQMHYENRLTVSREDAIAHDCRICRYCNSMNYHVKAEEQTLAYYRKNKGMEFNWIDGVLYVKTDISCWKLIYLRSKECLTLYHINHMPENFDFSHPQTCKYHWQDDAPSSDTIAYYLNYIYEHDRYKASVMEGVEITDFTSKKARNLAERVQKKCDRKRIDYIFKALEAKNPNYKKISCC